MSGPAYRSATGTALAAVLAVAGTVLVATGARPAPGYPAAPMSVPPAPAPDLAPDPLFGPLAASLPGRSATPAADPVPVSGDDVRHRPAAVLPRSVPVRLDIPAIDVGTALVQLGLEPDGTVALPPPGRHAPAGWYRDGASPGTPGPAVILGHVDSAREGPAVFHRLRELRPGATVLVRRADGRTAAFTVTRVARHRKSAFPTQAVYGPVGRPVLRLVTCGGSFDRIGRTYRDNVIAYAELTAVHAGGRPTP